MFIFFIAMSSLKLLLMNEVWANVSALHRRCEFDNDFPFRNAILQKVRSVTLKQCMVFC